MMRGSPIPQELGHQEKVENLYRTATDAEHPSRPRLQLRSHLRDARGSHHGVYAIHRGAVQREGIEREHRDQAQGVPGGARDAARERSGTIQAAASRLIS